MIDKHYQFQSAFFNINNWCIWNFIDVYSKYDLVYHVTSLTLLVFFIFFLDPYRRRGGPVTPIIEPFPDPTPGPFPPIPQSPIPCRFGLQLNQQGLCTNFLGNQQCAAGFVCLFGPADEPGPCCLSEYLFCCYFKSFSVFWNYVFSMNMFCCGVLVWSWLFLTVLFCYVDVI